MNENIHIGRRGEFIAAGILEGHGLRTSHVDIERDDLWVKSPDGVIQRCQVKSTLRPIKVSPERKVHRYNFQLKNAQAYDGLYDLVALDLSRLIVRTWDELSVKVLKLNPDVFTEEEEAASIKRNFNL